MIAMGPHGIFCSGWTVNMIMHKDFEGKDYKFLVSSQLMKVPIISDIMKFFGGDSVDKESMIKIMKKGQNLALMPGGFEESTIFQNGKHRLFIKDRKGFIKYALQYNYKIYPAYTFGEEQCFFSFPYLLPLRLLINKLKLPSVLFLSKNLLFPNDECEILTVFGRAIEMPHIETPTKE
jgi:hypothetical protein